MHPSSRSHTVRAFVGIDVSKDHLDAFHRVHDGAEEKARRGRFPNTPEGHRALIAWIGTGPVRVCLEASGLVRPRRRHRSV